MLPFWHPHAGSGTGMPPCPPGASSGADRTAAARRVRRSNSVSTWSDADAITLGRHEVVGVFDAALRMPCMSPPGRPVPSRRQQFALLRSIGDFGVNTAIAQGVAEKPKWQGPDNGRGSTGEQTPVLARHRAAHQNLNTVQTRRQPVVVSAAIVATGGGCARHQATALGSPAGCPTWSGPRSIWRVTPPTRTSSTRLPASSMGDAFNVRRSVRPCQGLRGPAAHRAGAPGAWRCRQPVPVWGSRGLGKRKLPQCHAQQQ